MFRLAAEFRGTKRGEVYVLGNGPGLKDAVIPSGAEMIGINRSWMDFPAPVHCIVDRTNMVDVWASRPETVFAHERVAGKLERYPGAVVLAKARAGHEFSWDLAGGCPISFGGLFGVQTALWLGYDTIHLPGFDEHDDEGRFYDEDYLEDSRESHREWFRRVAKAGVPARFVVDKSSALYPILVN
jgi:hypothetical protein